jgi:hypothetical protein
MLQSGSKEKEKKGAILARRCVQYHGDIYAVLNYKLAWLPCHTSVDTADYKSWTVEFSAW